MNLTGANTRQLRHSRGGALVALLAMLLQVLFAAEHASAMAAAIAKGGSDGKPLGFLDICTAQGLLRIPAPTGDAGNTEAPATNNGAGCAVCATAAATGAADMPLANPTASTPTLLLIAVVEASHVGHVETRGFDRTNPVRAPPFC